MTLPAGSFISHWDRLKEIYAEDEALGEIFEANGVYAYEEIYDEFAWRFRGGYRPRFTNNLE